MDAPFLYTFLFDWLEAFWIRMTFCYSSCSSCKTTVCSFPFLQVICDKIFRRWFSPNPRGPLVSLPLQLQLQKAVQECAEPGHVDAAGHPRTLKSLSELYHLLRVTRQELQRAE